MLSVFKHTVLLASAAHHHKETGQSRPNGTLAQIHGVCLPQEPTPSNCKQSPQPRRQLQPRTPLLPLRRSMPLCIASCNSKYEMAACVSSIACIMGVAFNDWHEYSHPQFHRTRQRLLAASCLQFERLVGRGVSSRQRCTYYNSPGACYMLWRSRAWMKQKVAAPVEILPCS